MSRRLHAYATRDLLKAARGCYAGLAHVAARVPPGWLWVPRAPGVEARACCSGSWVGMGRRGSFGTRNATLASALYVCVVAVCVCVYADVKRPAVSVWARVDGCGAVLSAHGSSNVVRGAARVAAVVVSVCVV